MLGLNFASNPYNFLPTMVALKNFYGGWGNLEFLSQKFNERLVCLSLYRLGSHFNLNPIPIGTHHLVFRRLGLKIDFQDDVFHFLAPIRFMSAAWNNGMMNTNPMF